MQSNAKKNTKRFACHPFIRLAKDAENMRPQDDPEEQQPDHLWDPKTAGERWNADEHRDRERELRQRRQLEEQGRQTPICLARMCFTTQSHRAPTHPRPAL